MDGRTHARQRRAPPVPRRGRSNARRRAQVVTALTVKLGAYSNGGTAAVFGSVLADQPPEFRSATLLCCDRSGVSVSLPDRNPPSYRALSSLAKPAGPRPYRWLRALLSGRH